MEDYLLRILKDRGIVIKHIYRIPWGEKVYSPMLPGFTPSGKLWAHLIRQIIIVGEKHG